MKLFRDDNTDGYTKKQLAALNAEWEEKVAELCWEEGDEEYDIQAKAFADEVSHR